MKINFNFLSLLDKAQASLVQPSFKMSVKDTIVSVGIKLKKPLIAAQKFEDEFCSATISYLLIP